MNSDYTDKARPLLERIHKGSSFLFDGLAIHMITVFARDEVQVHKVARDSEISTIRVRIGQRNEDTKISPVEHVLRFSAERIGLTPCGTFGSDILVRVGIWVKMPIGKEVGKDKCHGFWG